MYDIKRWQDEVLDQDGNILQEGTLHDEIMMNRMEEGIYAANEMGAILLQQVVQHNRSLEDLEGETGQINLTNSMEYPFNNSTKTIALKRARDTVNYRVSIEVLSSDGMVGDVRVFDKQLNGFKVAYTGSAQSAVIKYYVQGGMCQ